MSRPQREPFNPLKVSPSRIGTYADCGQKFKFEYVDRITPERSGSAALFGSVMHRARETWALDHEKDLIELTRAAWLDEVREDVSVSAFIKQYQALSGRAIRQEEEIRRAWAAKGKESKAPRMTKEWKESSIAKEIAKLLAVWIPKLQDSTWEFTERDPLPALYDESLVLAWKYQEKYRPSPNSWMTEIPFDFEWEGFQLVGYIDDISPMLDRETGEMLGVGIIDAKTYRVEPDHEFKDWRQTVIYKLAFCHLRDLGAFDGAPWSSDLEKLDIYTGIDRMRLLDRRWFKPDEKDERRLLAELRTYKRGVENEVFIPASKTCKAQFCDFAKQCAFWHGNASEPVELNVA